MTDERTDLPQEEPNIPIPPPLEEEPRFEERSIAAVSERQGRRNILAAIGLGLFVVLGLWYVFHDRDPSKRITDPVEEAFDEPGQRGIPNLVADDIAIPRPSEPQPPSGTEFDAALLQMSREMAEKQALALAKRAEERKRSPMMVVDRDESESRSAGASQPNPVRGYGAGTGGPFPPAAVPEVPESSLTGEEEFANRVGGEGPETVYASRIRNGSDVVVQGTMIRGVLETAIQSDLPGFIRAEVAHDVYSFDGSQRLIPKGSRLVGQYKSGLARGQARLYVVWTRLVRPDGVSVDLGSPGTDLLGRSGLSGDLDTHFFKIFGASTLLSLVDGVIDVAVARAKRRNGDGDTIYSGAGSDASNASEIALENSIDIPPTIAIDQGTPIQVFVAKDLDFGTVRAERAQGVWR